MSITGKRSLKVTSLEATKDIALKNTSGNNIFKVSGSGISSVISADLGAEVVKINKIQPSSGTTLTLDAASLKLHTPITAGYMYCATTGILSTTNDIQLTSIDLNNNKMLVGNASNQASEATNLSLTSTELSLTGDMKVSGSLKKGNLTYTLPSSSGTISMISDITLNRLIVPSGNIIVGNASSQASSSDIVRVSDLGVGINTSASPYYSLTVNSGLCTNVNGIKIGGVTSKTGEGSYIDHDDTPSGCSTNLLNYHNGGNGGFHFCDRNIDGSVLFEPLTTTGNNVAIGGNLVMTGSINSGALSLTLPSSSGTLAITSQIPTSMSVGAITSLPESYVIIGNASSQGMASSTVTVASEIVKINTNLYVKNNLKSDNYTFSLPSTNGTLAITSQIPTSMNVGSITGMTSGYIVTANTSDSTIASNIIKIDTQNSRVGINNTSPSYSLDLGQTNN